jgi:hypothetical protein
VIFVIRNDWAERSCREWERHDSRQHNELAKDPLNVVDRTQIAVADRRDRCSNEEERYHVNVSIRRDLVAFTELLHFLIVIVDPVVSIVHFGAEDPHASHHVVEEEAQRQEAYCFLERRTDLDARVKLGCNLLPIFAQAKHFGHAHDFDQFWEAWKAAHLGKAGQVVEPIVRLVEHLVDGHDGHNINDEPGLDVGLRNRLLVRHQLPCFFILNRCEKGQHDIDQEAKIHEQVDDGPGEIISLWKCESVGQGDCDKEQHRDYVEVPLSLCRVVLGDEAVSLGYFCFLLFFLMGFSGRGFLVEIDAADARVGLALVWRVSCEGGGALAGSFELERPVTIWKSLDGEGDSFVRSAHWGIAPEGDVHFIGNTTLFLRDFAVRIAYRTFVRRWQSMRPPI